MIVKGVNIEEKYVEYRRLSDYDWTKKYKINGYNKKLELLYSSIEEQAKEQTISAIDIDDRGIVVMPQNALNHRCSNSIESLQGISNHGLLASEWFGELESEGEGCFCKFVSRMKGSNYPYHGDLAEDDRSRLNIGINVILFLLIYT